MLIASGSSIMSYISSTGADQLSTSSAGGLTNATWTHVAVEYVPSTRLTVYKDGTLFNENTTGIYSALHNSTSPAAIGSYGAGTNKFNGKICDCRIYDAAIGSSKIAGLAAGTDYQTNLIGWWLDDTDDATTDHAGTFSTATNNGSTYSTDAPNG